MDSKGTEEHPGVHRSLVEQALWQQAQAVLDARRRGQYKRLHHHCLKPILVCGARQARLLVHKAKTPHLFSKHAALH